MTFQTFSHEFKIKLAEDTKQYAKLDLTPDGHKFRVKVFGSKKKLTFNIKNIGKKSVYVNSVRLEPYDSYSSKYGFQLDPWTSVDLYEIFSWCKPEEVTITLELKYETITKKGN